MADHPGPCWVACPGCEDFWCLTHKAHAHNCPCPPAEEWEGSPYVAAPYHWNVSHRLKIERGDHPVDLNRGHGKPAVTIDGDETRNRVIHGVASIQEANDFIAGLEARVATAQADGREWKNQLDTSVEWLRETSQRVAAVEAQAKATQARVDQHGIRIGALLAHCDLSGPS